MAAREKADWSAQRERLLKHRTEILALMDAGRSMTKIRVDLGMEDVPYSTFHHHASRFRDAGAAPENREHVSERLAGRVTPPSSILKPTSASIPEIATEPAVSTQPERASISRSDPDISKKAPPQKRKLVTTGSKEPENEEQGYDPAKWKKLDT